MCNGRSRYLSCSVHSKGNRVNSSSIRMLGSSTTCLTLAKCHRILSVIYRWCPSLLSPLGLRNNVTKVLRSSIAHGWIRASGAVLSKTRLVNTTYATTTALRTHQMEPPNATRTVPDRTFRVRFSFLVPRTVRSTAALFGISAQSDSVSLVAHIGIESPTASSMTSVLAQSTSARWSSLRRMCTIVRNKISTTVSVTL